MDSVAAMDFRRLRPATQEELRLIELGIARFSEWFNAPTVPPHRFNGRPSDFAALDWVFYELGGALWYRDNGYAFTCVWGNVLVQSFGFQWSVLCPPRDLRDYLLSHPENHRFFPWTRLWEAVENPGVQFEKSQSVWLQILENAEVHSWIPPGWSPAEDAIRGRKTEIPPHVINRLVELSERSIDRSPSLFGSLGMVPYEWTSTTDWAAVESWLQQLIRDIRQ